MHGAAVDVDRHHLAVLRDRLVADEPGLVTGIVDAGCHLEFAGRARLLPLTFHSRVETGFIQCHVAFAANIGRQIERKAKRVVQRKGRIAVKILAILRQRGFEDFHPVLERLAEAFFFLLQHLFDARRSIGQLRIGLAHFQHQILDQPVKERLGLAQLVAVAQCAADDAAQDITAPFIARDHAVDDQERTGTDVVGDHAQGIVGEVGAAGFTRGGLDQALEQIDFIIGMHVLQHRSDPLQAHAGIDARLRQRMQRAVLVLVELHEHQIPDFDVAITVLLGASGRAAPDFRTVVVEDLRAWTARAGLGHLPKIVRRVARTLVVADAHDALGRHADLVLPDRVRLVVFLIDGNPQLFLRQPVDDGQ